MAESFRRIDIPCEFLDMRRGIGSASGLVKLSGLLRERAPHLVQGWMYHGNIAATFAASFLRPRVPVLWNIRGSLIDPAHDRRLLTALAIRAGGKLSFAAEKIINNSAVSAAQHEQLGYCAAKRVILPNGFDVDVFRPCAIARREIREALGLDEHAILVGLIGRYHPMKDHSNFIQAAAALKARGVRVHYVMAGEGVEWTNAELVRSVETLGLNDRVHLLAKRDDIPTVTAALDIAVSASASGEGFPNIVGEAMSCAVPCVVTNVGDSAYVVGDTGRVVPPRDAAALAAALEELIALSAARRAAIGERARQRIIDNFSLDAVVRKYQDLYADVYRNAHAA